MATLISAPLPDLDLEEKSVLTVDTGDAAAPITRIVIHFSQDLPPGVVILPSINPIFTYGPGA